MNAMNLITAKSIVPVVVIEDAAKALPLARTLFDAGIQSIEITLRTDAAMNALETITRASTGLVVGAGSVVSPEQLIRVQAAGADFAVSPGSTSRLLDEAEKQSFPFVPGAATASEVMNLLDRGYTLQKFFPAEPLGGLAMIQALAAPIRSVRFFPTGGINAPLAATYLRDPSIHCLGGSWFVPKAALAAGDFETIARLAKEAQSVALSAAE